MIETALAGPEGLFGGRFPVLLDRAQRANDSDAEPRDVFCAFLVGEIDRLVDANFQDSQQPDPSRPTLACKSEQAKYFLELCRAVAIAKLKYHVDNLNVQGLCRYARIGGLPHRLPAKETPGDPELPAGAWAWAWHRDRAVVHEMQAGRLPDSLITALASNSQLERSVLGGLKHALGKGLVDHFDLSARVAIFRTAFGRLQHTQMLSDALVLHRDECANLFALDELQRYAGPVYWPIKVLASRGVPLSDSSKHWQSSWVGAYVRIVRGRLFTGDLEQDIGAFQAADDPVTRYALFQAYEEVRRRNPDDPFGPKVNPFMEGIRSFTKGLIKNPPKPTYEECLSHLELQPGKG